MLKKTLLIFSIFLFAIAGISNARQTQDAQNALNQLNRDYFIPNMGQWNPEVKYLARIGGMNAWITTKGVVYDFYKIKKTSMENGVSKTISVMKGKNEKESFIREGDVVRMSMEGGATGVETEGVGQRSGCCNYFVGNDKSKWVSGVPLYDEVVVKGVYKGIDVRYYYDNGKLRYDYMAEPGADISQINLSYKGQEGLGVGANGDLVLKTSVGEVTNGKIYAYQQEENDRKEVKCEFEKKSNGRVGLKVEKYDANKQLIIDPLVYSTYLGGSIDDYGYSIAVDGSGSAYITGYTYSTDFPVTAGAYQVTSGGNGDAFVTKLKPDGSGLIYTTYLGGNGTDKGTSIAVDGGGNVYITGYTYSTDFPVTTGALQNTLNSAQDAFVTKLNASGDTVYSTYLGGSGDDNGTSIAIDGSGNAYITGATISTDFPVTTGAFQDTLRSTGFSNDAFVTKLDASGDTVYSTYLGGNYNDIGKSIVVDGSGNAYITGYTYSTNFPTTAGVSQPAFGGGGMIPDAFVTKLSASGDTVYSTYLGGISEDEGNSIAIDGSGNAYITGYTKGNFPVTVSAYQTTFGGGTYDAFVTKLDASGDRVYSTYLGGSGNDKALSIAVDGSGSAYITGYTDGNFPVTNGAYQTIYGGSTDDAFVTKLDASGDAVYSTYLGGSNIDQDFSIAVDASDNVYMTGATLSADFPVTSGAYQTSLQGSYDVYVTKLSLSTPPPPITTSKPALSLVQGPLSYTEGDGAVQVSNQLIANDAGSLTYASGVVSISSNYSKGEDYLVFTSRNGITGAFDSTSGVLLLSGISSVSNYQDALRSVKYENTSQSPSLLPRTVSYTVNDGSAVSNTVSRQITVTAVNNPPVINSSGIQSIEMKENTPYSFGLSAYYQYIQDPDNADSTLTLSMTYTGSNLAVVQKDTTITITPGNNWYGKDTVKLSVSDGTTTVSTFVGVTVTHVNQLPEFVDMPDSLQLNGTQPVVLDMAKLVKDVETPCDSLKYQFSMSVDSLVCTYDPKTEQLSISALSGYNGAVELTVKVTDTEGGESSHTTSVSVENNGVTGVSSLGGVPKSYALYQNYPNPFNPSTQIKYALPEASSVVLKIYNVLGQEVMSLINGEQRAGYYDVMLDANKLSSGIYIYILRAKPESGKEGFRSVQKMILMK